MSNWPESPEEIRERIEREYKTFTETDVDHFYYIACFEAYKYLYHEYTKLKTIYNALEMKYMNTKNDGR